MQQGRKPPARARVVALRGEHRRDVVLQSELLELEGAQRAEWIASKRAALLSETIKQRLAAGAEMEIGGLYFDAETELVRSRKLKVR